MIASAAHEIDELRDLYRELIIDHSKSPRHFGKLADATHYADGINPLCGDRLKLYLRIDDENQITAASFEGAGCAISVASASLLMDTIIGLDVAHALEFFKTITGRLAPTDQFDKTMDTVDIGKLHALDGVRKFPARVKCATLAWHALNSAIHRNTNPASTE